jgi:hypothetical protein
MSVFVSEVGFPYDAHALSLLSGSFIRVEALHHLELSDELCTRSARRGCCLMGREGCRTLSAP